MSASGDRRVFAERTSSVSSTCTASSSSLGTRAGVLPLVPLLCPPGAPKSWWPVGFRCSNEGRGGARYRASGVLEKSAGLACSSELEGTAEDGEEDKRESFDGGTAGGVDSSVSLSLCESRNESVRGRRQR